MHLPQLLTATRILEHTMPVTSRRLLIYGAITLGLIFAILVGAGTFFGLAAWSDNPAFWGRIGAILGLTGALYALKSARPYLFHRLELLQLLAIARRIRGERLPAGKDQLTFLRAQVETLFPNARNAHDYRRQLLEAVTEIFLILPPSNRLRGFPETIAKKLAEIFIGFSVDALVTIPLCQQDRTTWRRGIAAFCQHYPTLFQQILVAKAFLYGMVIVAFWLLLKPVGWVDEALPSDMGFWRYVFAAILTYWIKASFLNPIVTAALMLSLLPLAEETDEHRVSEWWQRIPALAGLSLT